MIKEKYKRLNIEIAGIEQFHDSPALLYHENSKIDKHTARRQAYKIGLFSAPYVMERSSQPFKQYPGKQLTPLEEYKKTEIKADFSKVLRERTSSRIYNGDYKLSLNELHKILHYSYGISRTEEASETVQWKYRHVPSAGGLYPLELYIFLFSGLLLKNGLYHYRPDIDNLELLYEKDYREAVNAATGNQTYIDIAHCSCVIFITSIIERQMIKYGERAYRFMLIETGLVSQNISLICQSLGLGSCMLGFYYDDKINELLAVDGIGETTQNAIVIGKPRS